MFNRIVAGLLMIGTTVLGAVTPATSGGLTDETLQKAGWFCFQPIPEVIACPTPGLGLPPIPPVADSSPTFEFLRFDPVTHKYVGVTHMIRYDLYADQPCQGGGPYTLIPFLGYYECHVDHKN